MMSRTAASRQHTQRDGQGVGGRASGASSREGILAIERAPSAPSDPALSMAEVACRPMSASHGLAGAVEGLRARGERRASRVGGCTYRAGQGDARTVEAEAPAGAKAGRAWRAARSTARDAKSASAGSTQSGLKRPFYLYRRCTLEEGEQACEPPCGVAALDFRRGIAVTTTVTSSK